MSIILGTAFGQIIPAYPQNMTRMHLLNQHKPQALRESISSAILESSKSKKNRQRRHQSRARSYENGSEAGSISSSSWSILSLEWSQLVVSYHHYAEGLRHPNWRFMVSPWFNKPASTYRRSSGSYSNSWRNWKRNSNLCERRKSCRRMDYSSRAQMGLGSHTRATQSLLQHETTQEVVRRGRNQASSIQFQKKKKTLLIQEAWACSWERAKEQQIVQYKPPPKMT